VVVAHTYNPTYLGGEDGKDYGLMLAPGEKKATLSEKKKKKKKGLET
jgi:hypothetical protein